MAEVIPQINIDGTKIKNTWTEKEYVTDEVYNALNKAVIDLKDNNNLLDSNSILFREEYNSSSKNLNNAIHQGVYSFTNSSVNAPSGVNGGNLFVTNTSKTNQGSSIITQIAFCHNGAIYIRTKNTTENFTNWILVSGNTGGIKNIKGSNDTLTITNGDNSTQDITINNIENSTKAKQDSTGQTINTTYVKDVTVSNDTLTITKGDDSNNNIVINNIQQAKFSNNINKGYNNGDTPLPTKTFRSDVLKLSGVGYSVQPMHCASVRDNVNNCAGIAFSGGWDTNGFLQMAHNSPKAWIGGGSKENINWYKELAFTESPAFTGTPTAPTPETSDNSTKMATTAFVKSLFTASKATNGWHKEASTGFIWQWGQEANYHDIMDENYGSGGSLNFPISFPNKCLAVMPYLIGSRTFCCVSVSSFTNATITVHWDEWASSVQSVKFGYIAVGY